jgi:hypothetical protein
MKSKIFTVYLRFVQTNEFYRHLFNHRAGDEGSVQVTGGPDSPDAETILHTHGAFSF